MLKIIYEVAKSFAGMRSFDVDIIVNHLIPIVGILALLISSLWLIWKQRGKFIPLGISGLLSVIMFTLNSNVVSGHRYVLPCLGVYVALYLVTRTKQQTVLLLCLCGAGILTQIYLMALFISGEFAG